MTKKKLKDDSEVEALGLWPKLFGASWAGVAFLTTLSFWQTPFLLNLVSAFRFQLFLILAALSIPPLFIFKGKQRLIFVGFPLVVGLTFAGYLIGAPGEEIKGGVTLNLSVTNISSGNQDTSRLAAWLQNHPPDLLGILENTSKHEDALRALGFEHMIIHSRESNFGIALLCKTPPLEASILGEDSPFPSILAEFEDFQLLLTHSTPPISKEARELGDRQMLLLSKLVKSASKPTVVMGDFNATGWDARLLPLKEAGFRDARRGFGILATWPAGRPFMQIPIDHIFVSEPFRVLDCARGPDIGSDHYPLRATLQISH